MMVSIFFVDFRMELLETDTTTVPPASATERIGDCLSGSLDGKFVLMVSSEFVRG